jgi:hypothetical protein
MSVIIFTQDCRVAAVPLNPLQTCCVLWRWSRSQRKSSGCVNIVGILPRLLGLCASSKQNKVLRDTFGPKRDEVTAGCRKLHNEELRDLYSSPRIIRIIKSRRMGWAGHVARMGEKRNAYRLLMGKLEGKRPLGRSRRRLVDNITIRLGRCGLDWSNSG